MNKAATPKVVIPEGFKMDRQGRLVPLAMIKEQELMRDQVAHELGELGETINQMLVDFKGKALKDLSDLVSIAADKYDVTMGGEKGNLKITSYDGKYQVRRIIADKIEFTEEIVAAKELVDKCVERWVEGANKHLIVAVEHAFRVNKQGHLIPAEILAMLQWEIDDEQWKAAMDAISDAIFVNGSTVYVRVYKRDDSGKYIALPLSLSGVEA